MDPRYPESQPDRHHEASHPSHTHEGTPYHGVHSLSKREKMVMRLAYCVRHNSEHADFFGKLADEVAELGDAEAAQRIRAAAACTKLQNEHLKEALTLLDF